MAMVPLKELPSDLVVGSSVKSLEELLESQRDLFHNQIEQLRNIVVTQCNLTGVNPLSQEMAAGAFSVIIGKRPRDLLNPKSVKYMQSVFSIKDAISKKETREISALFGLTVAQVRDFFVGQRSKLRKVIQLSKEKTLLTTSWNEPQNGIPTNADSAVPTDPVPLSFVAPSSAAQTASLSKAEVVLPGIGESDKHFVDNIFKLIRQEETFGGEIKLMEWILQIENPSVLCWFLSQGGLLILATWLSVATTEEQTDVLDVALRVLCHLPLRKAFPSHMSAILQVVNRLRFYQSSETSNRAKMLLSSWSKTFAKNHSGKDPICLKSYIGCRERDLKLRKDRKIDESYQSSRELMVIPAEAGLLAGDIRSIEPPQELKLLTGSSDDSNKKQIHSTYNKEKRKVLLVEAPGQKTVGKRNQVSRAVLASQGRPITADEIHKAKMRAQFMQSKHGKAVSSADEILHKDKIEGQKKPFLLTNDLLSASEAYVRPKMDSHKKAKLITESTSDKSEPSDDKSQYVPGKSTFPEGKRAQVKWRIPPGIRINPVWRVGAGENSKEIDVQRSRNSREEETVYQTHDDIPLDPKEPWDVEMDYDDSLTPEIPIEALPDVDGPIGPHVIDHENALTCTSSSHQENAHGERVESAAEPDLELLAVLLQNPDLVFALTGQASGLSSEETVKLLDTIKSTGGVGMLNGFLGHVDRRDAADSVPYVAPQRNIQVSIPSQTNSLQPSRHEVSLPSPTPSTDPATGGWRPEPSRNPFGHYAPRLSAVSATAGSSNNSALQQQRLYDHDTWRTQRSFASSSVTDHTLPDLQPLGRQMVNHSAIPSQTLPSPTRDLSCLSAPQPQPSRHSLQQSAVVGSQPPVMLHHERFSISDASESAARQSMRESSSVHGNWIGGQVAAPNSYGYQTNQHNNSGIFGGGECSSLQRNHVTEFQSPSPERGGRGKFGAQGWNSYTKFGRRHGPPDWPSGRQQNAPGNGWYHDR